MEFRSILKILPVIAFAIICFAVLSMSGDLFRREIGAYETSCPEHMTPHECLDYLQQQAAQIDDEKNQLEDSISAEEFEQLSLSQQINYLASEIARIEIEIAEKEVDIERKNMEIKLLGEDIVELQNDIDTLTQEITTLENIMKKRTKTSYKMSLMSPLEILLDSEDFESLMRRMKYVLEVKKKDRELMADMSVSQHHLQDEEEILEEKRAEVQEKRNEIESQRAELAEDNKNLESQKSQQQVLMAESQRREQEYQNNLAELTATSNAITQQITALIIEMYNQGQLPANTPVTKGQVIGFQGHTGFSYGSHLHFELSQYGARLNPFPGGYLSGGSLYSAVGSGSLHAPLAGGILTQTYHGGHLAIDLMSASYGHQAGGWYTIGSGEICCFVGCVPAGSYPLRGEGAPVYAVESGMITEVQLDACGGKYTLIDHGNGLVTMYLHLR